MLVVRACRAALGLLTRLPVGRGPLGPADVARGAPLFPVVGAGIGTAVVEEAARRLKRGYVAFDGLIDVAPDAATAAANCAPAVALALLAPDLIGDS